MRIVFIKPGRHRKGMDDKDVSFLDFPSLTFPTLAAVTPPQHSLSMVDGRFEEIDFNMPCDLVGITAFTCEAPRAYEIADEFRRRGTTVVLGGPHVTALPDEAKTHADSVVIGEADESWPRLLQDLEKGTLQPLYQQTNPTDIRNLPPPDMSILSHHRIYGGLQSTRGCPNGCKFCFIGNSRDGRVFRKRPIEDVVKEIQHTKEKVIMFYDASMTIDVEHTKALFRAIRGLRKHFLCLGNINVLAEDDELLRLAKEAGVLQWGVGFESVLPESLSEARKKTNTVQDYVKAIEKIHSFKMNVRGFFIFGFDHDTSDVFDRTLDFIQTSHLDFVNFGILTPLPGLPLFKELEEQNRILSTDWGRYGYYQPPVFQPKILTETELVNGFKKAYRRYYSWDAIAKRFHYLVRNHLTTANLGAFFADNMVIRAYIMHHVRE